MYLVFVVAGTPGGRDYPRDLYFNADPVDFAALGGGINV